MLNTSDFLTKTKKKSSTIRVCYRGLLTLYPDADQAIRELWYDGDADIALEKLKN